MDGVTRSIPQEKVDQVNGISRTLKTRPKVSFPTGTEIGRPVSKTSIPRVKPSVDSMAMVRTTPSPSSKATSRTTFDFVGHFIDYKRIIDLRKFISNGKATSTTGPTT